MWIVRIALSRPYTFLVLALLLLILGPLAILRTPTDIFPNIDIPVISVFWSYTGLPPTDMANDITSWSLRYASVSSLYQCFFSGGIVLLVCAAC